MFFWQSKTGDESIPGEESIPHVESIPAEKSILFENDSFCKRNGFLQKVPKMAKDPELLFLGIGIMPPLHRVRLVDCSCHESWLMNSAKTNSVSD